MKKNKWRSIIRRLLVGSTVLLAIITIPVSLTPFLNPFTFWFIAVAGIAFPFLLACNFLLLLFWLFRKSKWCFLPLATLIVCFQQIMVLIGFGFLKPNSDRVNDESSFRILSWNVSRWDENNKEIKGGVSYRPLMFDAIKSSGADVLCLQEFFEPANPNETRYEKNIQYLQSIGYNYYYFFPGFIAPGDLKFGMSIFSKFPITDSAHFSFGNTPHSEGLMYADIVVKNIKIRIFSVHMESFRMGKNDYFGNINGGAISKARSFVQSIRSAYNYRASQARTVQKIINQSPYPVILSGNLGDVPNSYSYFTVRAGMKDAFLASGNGIGETFRFISPTLRLDYIMGDKKFGFTHFERPLLPYSDHYPLITEVNYANLAHEN